MTAPTPQMIPPGRMARLSRAMPYWLSLGLIPMAMIAAWFGGWALLLLPAYGWGMFSLLDALTGLDTDNADPSTTEADLFWYRLLTMIWVPAQIALLFGMIWWVGASDHLNGWEKIGLFFGVGVATGTVGINYSHELMHQRNRTERWCISSWL